MKAIGAGLKIDNASGVLTNVSSMLRAISGSNDTEAIDETVLQPDVVNPAKTEVGGFEDNKLSLTVLYTEASYTYFFNINRKEGLDYEYGPGGLATGKLKIVGLCNVKSVGFPSASTSGTLEFPVELSLTSRALGTF